MVTSRTSVGSWWFSRWGLVPLLVWLTACGAAPSTDEPSDFGDGSETATTFPQQSETSRAASETAQSASVSIESIDATQLEKFIKQQRGQVVLVDFWATWCPPCVEGLPHTVQLHRKYADHGVSVAAIAIDAADQIATIETLIQSLDPDPRFRAFLAEDSADLIEAMDRFEIESGTLPTLRLYDRSGQLKRTFGDGQPEPIRFEEIEVEIRGLLNTEASPD